MGWHTKYANLETSELLSAVDDARAHSPIIEELASRLEAKKSIPEEATLHTECPVCEAKLEADLARTGDLFTITDIRSAE